jgi:hypothetical protein
MAEAFDNRVHAHTAPVHAHVRERLAQNLREPAADRAVRANSADSADGQRATQDPDLEHVPVFVQTAGEAPANIPGLVSDIYMEAPAPLRTQLLECLLRPVGPLAIVTISAGAFAHLLYRLRLHGLPVTIEDAAGVRSEHVLELARYVAQASPETLLRIGSLIASSPLGMATVTGTALLATLGAWRRRARSNTSRA